MRPAARHPGSGTSLRALPGTNVSAITLSTAAVGVSSNVDPGEVAPLDDLITRSDADAGPMTPYDGLLTAVGAGTAMIRIATGSAGDAEQTAGGVEYRWNEGASSLTGQPYTELMEITNLSVDDTVAMIDFEQVRTSRVWSDLFLSRDTLPFIQEGDTAIDHECHRTLLAWAIMGLPTRADRRVPAVD